MARQRVAVVGAGVAGLTAAYLLQRRYDVTLYEAERRLGGHAHTHDVVSDEHGMLAVDSGFIVHNQRTYPHLIRLFRELGVETQPTEMSMSIRCDGCGLVYAGAKGAAGLFAQRSSMRNPSYLRMLLEVKRFHRLSRRVLTAGSDQLSLADFLTVGEFSQYFVQHFMVPLVSAVWSAGPSVALSYPARYLFAFLDNHGMLTVTGSPSWRTVVGGSRTYVERAAKNLTAVEVSRPVREIARTGRSISVRDDADEVVAFDRVVVATHADTALRLLSNSTDAEREALGAFRYSRNDTVLHTDGGILPALVAARASWNYLLPTCSATGDQVLVSYDVNRLQRLPARTHYVVSLNVGDRVPAERVIARMTYEHPIYTTAAIRAQQQLPVLNDGTIAYAGAYHGWGFHEDGCRSGVQAAASLGVPW